ncbi:insulator binding factor 2 [Haematobia irritans]|uniref:insulator binding factor 2 n=1 Tax=Haematobia irritans TaxID=7368 RepID=UPI003F4FFF4C
MWNKKLVELLIEKYREHNNLYNSQNPNYLDRSKRTKSLVEIANDLKQYCEEINVEEIKKKIHTLRSQFIRELRENHRRNDFEIKLWCFDQLEFLRPFCALRSTMPYVSNKKSPQHDEDTLLDEFEEIAVETSNKWEQNNSTNSKRYSNATDMPNSKRHRPHDEDHEYASTESYMQNDEISLHELPEESPTVGHFTTLQSSSQETNIEEIAADLSTGDVEDLIDVDEEEELDIIENTARQSKESLRLQQELCKAETEYYIAKSRYFSKLTENTKIKRALMVLQSRKLQLEIEKLTTDN